MKKSSTLLRVSLIAAFVAMGCSTQAQTNLSPGTFFDSARIYLTSQNTNYTFSNVKCELSTGYKQVTGVNAASYLDAQYDLASGLNFDSSFQFSGVGSPINGAEAGLGYNLLRQYDTALNAKLLGGYDDFHASGVIEPGVTIKKKGTSNTFIEIGLSVPMYFKGKPNTSPTFRAGAGITF